MTIGPRSLHVRAALFLGIGLFAVPAFAQSTIVNSQSMDLSALNPGWSAQLKLSASLAAGNVEFLKAAGNLKVLHQALWDDHKPEQAPWLKERWMLLGSVAMGKAGDKTIQNQGLVHLRWTKMWIPRVGHELFVQTRFNEFLRLAQRSLVGAGARFDLLNHKGWLGWAGTAYMFEYNKLDTTVEGDPVTHTLEHRWSSYLALRKESEDQRLLGQLSAFIQPRIPRFKDIRVFATLDLVAKVGAHVGVGLNAAVAYDAAPPLEVETTDLRLSSTLSFSL